MYPRCSNAYESFVALNYSKKFQFPVSKRFRLSLKIVTRAMVERNAEQSTLSDSILGFQRAFPSVLRYSFPVPLAGVLLLLEDRSTRSSCRIRAIRRRRLIVNRSWLEVWHSPPCKLRYVERRDTSCYEQYPCRSSQR